ncbi:MAG: branched-chain amino acid ABC transporter permease [Chloroflexi bacterium]|nr:MAG: branched-chain amino acid ABC transporter permease [Chloroflexota bacterium]
MNAARRFAPRVALLLVAIVAILLPVLEPNPASINVAVFTMMYVGLASAWNIMGGYTGYISLGHAGFFGLGAYTLGLGVAHLGIGPGYGPFALVPLAGLLTGLFALPIGWIALRTRAATFVIVTIAVMFMLQLAAMNLIGLTGGTGGLSLPVPRWSGDFYNTPFYYAMLILASLTIAVSWWIRRSKFGLGLLAIRDDEDKAMAVGVPTRQFKLAAFVISAALVGMIGGVYAYYVTYVYPEFVIDPLTGISMVLMAFLGGLGTLTGPVLGALLVEPAQLSLAYNFGASRLYLVFYSAVFLVVILLLPRGIVPSVRDLTIGWWTRGGPGRAAGPSPGPSTPAPGNVVAP